MQKLPGFKKGVVFFLMVGIFSLLFPVTGAAKYNMGWTRIIPLPDYTVQNAKITFHDISDVSMLFFEAEVKNSGRRTFRSSILSIQDKNGWGMEVPIKGLKKNETFKVVTKMEVPEEQRGDHLFTFFADSTRRIRESNERNNKAQKTVVIAAEELPLTVSMNPDNEDKVVVRNADDVTFAIFNFKAWKESDIRVDSITLTRTSRSGMGADHELENIQLYELGSDFPLTPPRNIRQGVVTFNDIALTIDDAETARIVVKADISGSATIGSINALGIAAKDHIEAIDELTANPISDEDKTLCEASSCNAAGDASDFEVTVAASGKLTIQAYNSPPAGRVPDGAEKVEFTRLRLSAELEDISVRKLRVYNPNTDSSDAIGNLYLYKVTNGVLDEEPLGEGQKGLDGSDNTWVFMFNNYELEVQKEEDTIIAIVANINSYQAIADIDGMSPMFIIYNLEDNWSNEYSSWFDVNDRNGEIDEGTECGDMKAVGYTGSHMIINTALAATDTIIDDTPAGATEGTVTANIYPQTIYVEEDF